MCFTNAWAVPAEEINTMSTGEDESSPGLNGRLRPRKSTAATPSPQSKTIRKTEGKTSQDRPKRNSTPSKAPQAKQDDLASKSDTAPDPLILCPYCDRKFASKQTATKHARRIHLPTTKQDTFIKCLHCNHSDAEAHTIIKHMVDNHPNQYFACLDCYTRFPSTTELAEHKHNVCEKQKAPYRSRLRQKVSTGAKSKPKSKSNADEKSDSPKENAQFTDNHAFNGIVISCELNRQDAADVEDKITTNLILPPSKALTNAGMEKNAVIVLDELTWNKRIPPNFSFHNTDADQILSRLGVVHRSPRVGESRKDLIRMMDEPNEKFEKCFDTGFYTRVTKNVQENLAKYLDGSFNFDPNKDSTIKTRKSKTSVVINTAEGFPILLAYEQFSRHLFDGIIPRSMAPKHKWKWDSAESDKHLLMLLDQSKRDSHVNNCIITLVSSLDIWSQLRMRQKFEEIYKTTPAAKKKEKQNIISLELKEILESRDIPTTSSQVVPYRTKGITEVVARSGLPEYLGLSPTMSECESPPAVLSGEWVRPRCYVCCACGEQTRDARALSSHITTNHPNAQVQHYEIVGETLLSADILKHLYVPPSQISNRTRPPRGFRDCTKCNKSVTLEDLHQHMLDCAGDTPTVRRKCRYRPFGVRRRRTRLPDNTIRKKMRKDIRTRRRRQKARMRPRVRTEVGDAETIRKMIADLPAKRNRITTSNVLRPRRTIIKTKKTVRLRTSDDAKSNKTRVTKILNKVKKSDKLVPTKKQNDSDNDLDEDDQPLKVSAQRISTRSNNGKGTASPRGTRLSKARKITKKQSSKKETMQPYNANVHYILSGDQLDPNRQSPEVPRMLPGMVWPDPMQNYSGIPSPGMYVTDPSAVYYNQLALESARSEQSIQQAENHRHSREEHYRRYSLEETQARKAIEHSQHSQIARRNLLQSHEMLDFRNAMAMEHVRQIPLGREYANQRNDVREAGMGNIRQHGNSDRYNVRNDNERPVGRRNESTHNSNIARTTNVPLKHSIARLTSQAQLRETPSLIDTINSQSSEIDVASFNELSEHFKTEKDVVSEKLDKPPLEPRDSIECHEAGRQLSIPNILHLTQNIGGSSIIIDDIVYGRESLEVTEGPEVTVELGRPLKVGGQPYPSKALIISQSSDDRRHLTAQQMYSSESIEEQRRAEKSRVKTRKTKRNINDITDFLRVKRLECPPNENANSDYYTASTQIPRTDRMDYALAVETQTFLPTAAVRTSDFTKVTSGRINTASTIGKTTDPRKEVAETLPTMNPDPNKRNRHTYPGPTAERSVNLMQNDQGFSGSTSVQHQSETNIHERSFSRENKAQRKVNRTRSSNRSDSITRANLETETSPWEEILPRQVSEHNPDVYRRNSYDGVATLNETEQFIAQQNVHAYNRFVAMNTRNLTKAFMESQHTDPNIVQFIRPNYQPEIYSQRTTAAVTKEASAQQSHDYYLNTQKPPVSPVSRRSRRKPAKQNLAMEMSPAYYKRNTVQRQTPDRQVTSVALSPLHHVSYKNIGIGPDPPPRVNFLPMVTSSVASTTPNTSPGSRARARESYKRALDMTEIETNIELNLREIETQTKILKRSTEKQRQNYSNLERMRRHSMELATAQTNVYNYEMSKVHAYSEQRENNINISPSTGSVGPSHIYRAGPDEYLNQQNNDDVRYDAKTLPSLYSPEASLASAYQDTGGVLHANLKPGLNKSDANLVPREIQDIRQIVANRDEMYKRRRQQNLDGQISRSRNDSDSSSEITKDNTSEYIYPEYGNQNSNALDKFTLRNTISRNTGEHHTLSPYRRNVLSTSAENIYEDFGARAYPIQPCNNSTAMEFFAMAAQPPPPPPPLLHPEDIPLDLSCESKVLKDKNVESYDSSSNIFKTPFEKNSDESSMFVNFPQNDHDRESLSSHTTFLNINLPEHEINQDIVYLPANDMLEETNTRNEGHNISINKEDRDEERKKKTPILTERNILTPSIPDSLTEVANTENLYYNSYQNNLVDAEKQLSPSDQPLSQRSEINNDLTSPPLHCLNDPDGPVSNSITKTRETTQEESQFIIQKNVRNSSSQSQIAHESFIISEASTTVVDLSISPSHDVTNGEANLKPKISGIKSVETSLQTCSQDILPVKNIKPTDNAETSKNIRLIPKPIVNILRKVPPETKSLLLNILVKYGPLPDEDIENYEELEEELGSENQQKNNTMCEDPLDLCIGTTMMSSNLISEKRDPPLVEILDSNEAQPSTSGFHQSHQLTLSHSSPMGHMENSRDKTNDTQNENYKESKGSELDPISSQVGYDTEVNVDDLTKPDIINKNIMTTDTNFVPPNSSQSVLQKPAKPKSSNEQTASLRAVRIKPTRKSSSDDINLQGINVNIHTVEKCANVEQIVNQAKSSYINEMNAENADAPIILETNDSVDTVLPNCQRNTTLADSNRKKEVDIHVTDMVRTVNETNENVTSKDGAISSEASQLNLLNTTHQGAYRVVEEITTEHQVAKQNDNMEIDHFLDSVNSTTYESGSDKSQEISSQKCINDTRTTEMLLIKSSSSICENSEKVLTSVPKPDLKKVNNDAAASNKINEEETETSADFCELKNVPSDNNEAMPSKLVSQTTKNLSKAILPKDNKSSDDSEDDISLAVIKQKHNDKPRIIKADTLNGKSARLSAKLKREVKNPPGKLVQKRQKKKKSLNIKCIQTNKQTEDSITTKIDRSSDVTNSIAKIDKEDQNKINTTTILIDKHENKGKNVICLDMNINISDDINNVEENDQNRQLENVIDTNIEQDHVSDNTIIIMDLNRSEKVKEPVSAMLADPQIDETYIMIKECQLELQKKNESLVPVQCLDTTKPNNVNEVILESCSDIAMVEGINSDLNGSQHINKLHLEAAEAEPLKLTNISTKDSGEVTTSPTYNDKLARGLQISPEIEEINTVPLRRSRRGKSMYVDISHIVEDEHVVQDIGQKSHLTMKRLILSRVEKDKERIIEGISIASDATVGHNLTDSEVTEQLLVRKVKRIKRKKSPLLKIKTKKTKSINEHNNEDETSDVGGIHNVAENNSAILRELPNAENKIEDKDNRVEDVKSHAIADNTTSISENSTLASKDNKCEFLGDGLSDTKETIVPGKRKLNISKTTDTVPSKSKKSKTHYKKKSNSDFDSDDDKGLLETKQQRETEKHLTTSSNETNNSDCASLQKDDYSKLTSDFIMDTDNPKCMPNASLIVETRTTCYNRDISNIRPRSSCDSIKGKANYDPYDIDFEDMLETAKPVIKKKGKSTGNSDKLKNELKLNTKHVTKQLTKKINSPPLDSIQIDSKIISSIEHHESDSDSSKSDVPLQKYVEEKALENQSKSKNNSDDLNHVENERKRSANNDKSDERILVSSSSFIEENNATNDITNAGVDLFSSEDIKIARLEEKDDNCLCKVETADMDLNLNINSNVDRNNQKLNKEKKQRRTLPAYNEDEILTPVSTEIDQQLKSDKFMENFGFFSERIPRKSNLLASKKISETFHMIGNDSDDSYLGYKEKTIKKSSPNENKKKSETCSLNVSQDSRSDGTCIDQSAATSADVVEPHVAKTCDESYMDDGEVDAATAQKILNSDHVKKMENDLIFGITETPDSNAAPFFVNYRRTNLLETSAPIPDPNISISHIESDSKIEVNPETKKPKSKADKPPGYKAKMYPDIEEIDMFEDKFDKIKRKRRSQAVAAKQVQTTVDTSTRNKSRKQAEKKKSIKTIKQSQNQNAQVLTKGALKGFDGIKISIPTQDLNMPPNVSPPRQQKRKKKASNKRRRDTIESDSTCSESEEKGKSTAEKDIYEFKDNEDTELLELRPSTVMDRFRSINKNKLKKDKGKSESEKDKPREKTKEKERKSEAKDKESTNEERVKTKRREKYDNDGKRHRKHASRDEKRSLQSSRKESGRLENDAADEEKYAKLHADTNLTKMSERAAKQNTEGKGNYNEDQSRERDKVTFEEADVTLPGTSGFVPDRMDESDYDSDVTSPEGDFIFYTSDDVNCICPSDNDSEDSDGERSCGRPNCIYKNRNADKNAAIGNIFKNNAVRCEKPEIKVPEQPKPDLDQLFDSLFETKPSDDDKSAGQNENFPERSGQFLAPLGREENTRKPKSPVSQQDLDVLSKRRERVPSTKASIPLLNDNKAASKTCGNKKNDDEIFATKYDDPYSVNEFMSDSEINADDHCKPMDIDICPMLENRLADLNEENRDSIEDVDMHEGVVDVNHAMNQTILESDYMRSSDAILRDDVMNSYPEVETGSQSGAIPEGANLESYTMEEQSAEYIVPDPDIISPDKSNDNIDIPVALKDDSRLGVEVSDTPQKSKPSKAQTEKKKRRKSYKHDKQAESDNGTSKHKERSGKEPRSKSRKNCNVPSETVKSEFAAPASPTVDDRSPTRDDGAGPSRDVDETVAPQRARRKCTVGKQNVLAEHWSSESEADGGPRRPNSADSAVTGARKKKKKKDQVAKKSRHVKTEPRRGASADRAAEVDVTRSRGPTGPKIRARAAQCWSSDGEDGNGPQPLHGWIVGNSHKKLVTLLAHKKGGKCCNPDST